MNFIVVGVPYYDYLVSTCVEGLHKLGHSCYDLSQEGRNYMKIPTKEMNIKPDVFIYAPLSNSSSDFTLDSPDPIIKVLLWVHDLVLPNAIHRFEPEHFKFDIAFVREMDDQHAKQPNIYPINFGIEDRFYQYTDGGIRGLGMRPYDIVFQGGTEGNYPHAAKRKEFLQRVKQDFEYHNLQIGNDKTKDPDPKYSQVVTGRHQHYSDYFLALSISKIGLCLHGAGNDCARTWEVAASGAVPAIQKYTTRHVEPWWKDGVNCIEFETYEEFKDKTMYYLDDDVGRIKLLNIQQRAWVFGRSHHRTIHRATYIIDKMQEQGLIDA